MQLLLENWRKFITEAHGLDTSWDNVCIDDVFKITGKSCKEGDGRKCESYTTGELHDKLKYKPIVDTLDPSRIENADPRHPLIVVVDRDTGEYQNIMDGNHRFANAKKYEKMVQVKELYTDEREQLFNCSEDQNETNFH